MSCEMPNAPVSIVPDKLFWGFYRLVWADGIVSADFYNLTRAKDNLAHYDRKLLDMANPGPVASRRARQRSEAAQNSF